MVVDAGGGTIDITAYEVTEGVLTEIGYTSGGNHGSTNLNNDFLKVDDAVRKRLRNMQDSIADAIVLPPSEVIQLFDRTIEPILRAYSAILIND